MSLPQRPVSDDPACKDPDCSYRPEVIHLHELVVRYRQALEEIDALDEAHTLHGQIARKALHAKVASIDK